MNIIELEKKNLLKVKDANDQEKGKFPNRKTGLEVVNGSSGMDSMWV